MAGGGYWVRRISSSISLIFSLTPMMEYYSRVGAEWGGFCYVCVGGIRSGGGVEGSGVAGLWSAGLTD